MKHFLIFTNRTKDKDLKMTDSIKEYLTSKGQRVSLCVDYVNEVALNEALKDKVDIMLVLGGDGTVLQAARATKEMDIPLIGINMGTLGYMTDVEPAHINDALDRLILGEYHLESRMMLKGEVIFNSDLARYTCEESKATVKDWALNDIVISRSGPLQLMKFGVYVNGKFLNEYNGDGIIVTTPTGSTGYNLSAGGPIIEPSANLIMITPICPHTLNQRSVIFSPEDIIEIEVLHGRDGGVQTAEVNFDGANDIVVHTDDRIRISKSSTITEFIHLNQVSFLEVLHKKMSER